MLEADIGVHSIAIVAADLWAQYHCKPPLVGNVRRSAL